MLFNMSLKLDKMVLSKVYNNVQINKKAKAGQNVNSNNKAVLTMSASSSFLYVNYWSWVNWENINLHWKFLDFRRKADAV